MQKNACDQAKRASQTEAPSHALPSSFQISWRTRQARELSAVPSTTSSTPEQDAEHPIGNRREIGQEIKRKRDAEKAAGENPTPIRKGPNDERENDLHEAFNHEIDEEEHAEEEESGIGMT